MGQKKRLRILYNKIKKKVKNKIESLKGLSSRPRLNIAINSLSLLSLIKHNISEKINIKGSIIVSIFGIK